MMIDTMKSLGGNKSESISGYKFADMLMFMSLEEIKSATIFAINAVKSFIHGNMHDLLRQLYTMCGSVIGMIKFIMGGLIITFLKRKKPHQGKSIEYKSEILMTEKFMYTKSIIFETEKTHDNLLMVKLLEWITNNTDKSSYGISEISNWKYKGLKNTEIIEIWNSVNFIIDGLTCAIPHEIMVYFEYKDGNKHITKCKNIKGVALECLSEKDIIDANSSIYKIKPRSKTASEALDPSNPSKISDLGFDQPKSARKKNEVRKMK